MGLRDYFDIGGEDDHATLAVAGAFLALVVLVIAIALVGVVEGSDGRPLQAKAQDPLPGSTVTNSSGVSGEVSTTPLIPPDDAASALEYDDRGEVVNPCDILTPEAVKATGMGFDKPHQTEMNGREACLYYLPKDQNTTRQVSAQFTSVKRLARENTTPQEWLFSADDGTSGAVQVLPDYGDQTVEALKYAGAWAFYTRVGDAMGQLLVSKALMSRSQALMLLRDVIDRM